MRYRSVAVVAAMVLLILALPRMAAAQTPVADVLSFLLTNRSIPTGDFVQDSLAAAATRDAISRFLLAELGTVPVSTSSGGFTYFLNPTFGSNVRASDSFGLFLLERSLTTGRSQVSFGVSYQSVAYDGMDGRSLGRGLVATASRLRGESEAFDVETLTMTLRTQSATLLANYGVADRLDLSVAVPMIRLSLRGQRLDLYRGQSFVQAVASASAAGPGDMAVRAKYNVFQRAGRGVSIGVESRLPTGDAQNLLGVGRATIKPTLILSSETERVGLHGNVGYSVGGMTREMDLGGAMTFVVTPRITIVGELASRRLQSFGRLTDVEAPHPALANVDTIRLTSVPEASTHLETVAGVKWNAAGTLLVSANVRKPITTTGLNARWVGTVMFDYFLGR